MTKDEIRQEKARLQGLLDQYESGQMRHLDEDERGHLLRDVTPERISGIRARIADFDRMLAEDWRD